MARKKSRKQTLNRHWQDFETGFRGEMWKKGGRTMSVKDALYHDFDIQGMKDVGTIAKHDPKLLKKHAKNQASGYGVPSGFRGQKAVTRQRKQASKLAKQAKKNSKRKKK